MKKRRRIVVINDTHGGSPVGLWPERHETIAGQVILASKAQLILLEDWEDFWKGPAKDADTVLLVGDLCEGRDPRGGGRSVIIADLEEQARAMLSILRPKCKGKRVESINGSLYHSSQDMELDAYIAKELGGKDRGILANLEVEGTGKIINIGHRCSEALLYRSTAIDRESWQLDAAIGSGQISHKIDLYIRAHWHWFDYMKNISRTLLVNPGWKLWAPIRPKGSGHYAKHLPVIGACVIDISEDDIVVKEKTYPLVHVYDALEEI